MAKRSVQRRVRAKRDAEKAARRRQGRIRKIRIGVGSLLAVVILIVLFVALRSDRSTNPLGQPTNKPTPTPTASPSVNPGCSDAKPAAYRGKQYKTFPPYRVNANRKYTAVMETSCGPVTLELLPRGAPKTVSSFVFLARAGFFDGVIFHRVIPGFMIQGGDPTGTGTGGPGYKFEDEIDKALTFDKAGVLAMANSGPATNGSQFFITDGAAAHLNGKHTIFGRVLLGQDNVKKIINVQRDPQDKPFVPVYILKVTITET